MTWMTQMTTASAAAAGNDDGEVVTHYGSYNNHGYNSYGGSYGGYGNAGYGLSDSYLADFNEEWATMSGRVQRPKCVDIPANLTLCQDIGYDKMTLPNLLQHDSLSEVTQQARSWVPLVNLRCHPDTQVFLCSLFSPVCLDREIFPCRTLCESVRDNCLARMKHYGFDWPVMLKCDKFPEDNDMCIKLIHDVKPDNNCSACKHPMTYEALIDNSCRSDFVARVKFDKNEVRDGDRALILKKSKRFYKKENITKRERSAMEPILAGGADCHCDVINDTSNRYLMMGAKQGDQLVVNYIIEFQKKNKEFKRALKNIRKGKVCEGIIEVLTINPDKNDRKDKQQGDGKCAACRMPVKYDTIVESYCLADFVLRVSVTGVEAKDGHLALLMKKRRKNFKKGAITRKEEKSMVPLLDGDEGCKCDLVANTKSKYLIFGNKRDDKYYVNYVIEFDKKDKDFKKALRSIRKGDVCLGLLQGTNMGGSDGGDKKKGGRSRKGKKRKKGKNRKKGRKGRKNKDNGDGTPPDSNSASSGK
nr:hypothetical protein BaRGS_014719 [Batillaria attramentaria]